MLAGKDVAQTGVREGEGAPCLGLTVSSVLLALISCCPRGKVPLTYWPKTLQIHHLTALHCKAQHWSPGAEVQGPQCGLPRASAPPHPPSQRLDVPLPCILNTGNNSSSPSCRRPHHPAHPDHSHRRFSTFKDSCN